MCVPVAIQSYIDKSLTSVVSSRRKQQLETSLLGHSIVWSGHVKKCQGAGKCPCYSIELILVFEVECHLT